MTNKKNPAKSNIHSLIKSLEMIIDDTLTVFQECKKIPQMHDSFLKEYETTCHRIMNNIHSQRLKIAVAGAIKSGKSTFINSLVGKDLVKRGAGVVTSITTRIRKGAKNRANIYFKSWDTINLQLQKALELFPDDGASHEFNNLDLSDIDLNNIDIRRKKDREALKKIFKILTCNFPVTQAGIQPETLLIQHAIQGFDSCNSLVQSDETSLIFESKKFDKYKDFTSDPDKAFYIKDVCLELYGKIIDPNIEIADCQGADSIDPGQLSQILNYLESANLIIYCISSRTGLRQADIIFLNQIKKLGLLDNIVFINNCDLSEHENFDDLIKIEKNIKDNLGFLEIKPKIFSLSSLYNLFIQFIDNGNFKTGGKSKLNKKDSIRLQLWQEEKKTVKYCTLQTREFNTFFQGVIDKNRHDFLISNHFNRLTALLSHLEQQTHISHDLLSSDKDKEKKAISALATLEQNANRIETMVNKTIEVNVQELKEKIHLNLKSAFIQDQSSVLNKTSDHIKNAAFVDIEQYKTGSESSFNQILYLMFQDFKRKLDLYVLENIKPELKSFVKTQEEQILSYFLSLFDSFQIDLKSDLIGDDDIVDVGNSANPLLDSEVPFYDGISYDGSMAFKTVKKILNLQIPSLIFEAKYTTKIKANVFTDFSLNTLSGILSSLFKQNSLFSFSPGLKKAAVKIKQENLKLIKTQYEQFYINLENDYFIPLIEAVTRDFKEKINERFGLYHTYKQEVESVFSLKQSEKQEQKNTIRSIQLQIQQLIKDIASASP
jgi:hypothetical protein